MTDLDLITNKLRQFGFFPEFSNKSKYLFKIKSYLGVSKAYKLLNNIDFILVTSEVKDAENDIAKLIGRDVGLLKIVYSTGIETSAFIFNCMLNILDTTNIEPKIITDLGGANGWTLQLLEEYFELSSELILIEQNSAWGKVNENINCINEEYNSVTKNLSSDLVVSIFGIPALDPEPLLRCAFNIMSKDGHLLIALRIPDNSTFSKFQLTAQSFGFGIILESSRRIQYQHNSADIETFPILLLSNSNTNKEIIKLEELILENPKIK
jgi:hypothetical protein